MGLDMYLTARKNVYSDENKAKQLSELFPELADIETTIGTYPISTVHADIAYWRKANAIHKWFVGCVQDGEDDCRSYFVPRSKFNGLRHLCETVLYDPSLAQTCLPTESGFFFGSTAIDEHYLEDLRYTISVIDKCLSMPEDWDFFYQSCW